MLSLEALHSLPPEALWDFFKWLAFGQARYVGIHILPNNDFGSQSERIQRLASAIAQALRHPADVMLSVECSLVGIQDDTALVATIAKYLAARHVALYRNAADFDPHDVTWAQESALTGC